MIDLVAACPGGEAVRLDAAHDPVPVGRLDDDPLGAGGHPVEGPVDREAALGTGLGARGADDPRVYEVDRVGGAVGGDDRGGEAHPDLGGGEAGAVRLAADPLHPCEEGEQGVVETLDGGGRAVEDRGAGADDLGVVGSHVLTVGRATGASTASSLPLTRAASRRRSARRGRRGRPTGGPMLHRLSLAISIPLFLSWLLITIGGGLLQAGGTTSLDELASSGIVFAIPGAALFLLITLIALGRARSVGLAASRDNRVLLVPSVAVTILLALSIASGLPTADIFLLLVVNTAFVGISEELAFRGVLLSSLLGRMSVRRAVLIGAVVFGAVHSFNAILTGEIVQALSQSVIAVGMGIWAGVVRVRTGSLVGPMVLHALWDLALFSVLTAAAGSALASITSLLAIVFVAILGTWGYRQLGRAA